MRQARAVRPWSRRTPRRLSHATCFYAEYVPQRDSRSVDPLETIRKAGGRRVAAGFDGQPDPFGQDGPSIDCESTRPEKPALDDSRLKNIVCCVTMAKTLFCPLPRNSQ